MALALLERMEHPVRGLLHGSAFLASLGGLLLLLANTDGTRMTVAVGIYGVALCVMYVTSSLYHSVPWRAHWKRRWQKLDHTFIYVLVAATFTPMAVGVASGFWMVVGLAAVWALALFGLGRELAPIGARRVWTPLQVMAVGVVLAPLWVTLVAMDGITALLTVGGGAIYLLGVALFTNGRPRLIPGVFSHHEFFHVMVILASVAHFVAIWRLVSLT